MRQNPYIVPRLQQIHVTNAIAFVKERFPDRHIVVLTDDAAQDFGGLQVYNYAAGSICDFGQFDPDRVVFLYAFNLDDIGSPVAREIIRRGGKFVPVRQATPHAKIFHIDARVRNALSEEFDHQQKAGFSKWDPDFDNIAQAILQTQTVPGVFIEVGAFQGSSGCAALAVMKATGQKRDTYFLDVFEGFDYDVAKASADTVWEGTHKSDGMSIVAERLKRFESADLKVNVIRNNIIHEDLPLGTEQIALANLDVDIYEGVRDGLVKLAPRMAVGGILIVEDPGHTPWLVGARVALDEFFETEMAKRFMALVTESGQTLLIRLP